jgi:hypothetical protein
MNDEKRGSTGSAEPLTEDGAAPSRTGGDRGGR